jgi:hypothetical protein
VDAVRLARLNTVVAVGAVGGVLGHVIAPFAPGAGWTRPALFVLALLGTGAVRGWRDAVVRGERQPGRVRRSALLHGLGALAAALLGYVGFHGIPS